MASKYVPSMASIARELGVSVATVSRALKGGSRHSKGTTARVHEVAARLGYSPNLLISGIRGSGTRTIGVSMAVGNDFFLGIFNGILKGLWQEGYAPLVLAPQPEVAGFTEKDLLDALVSRRVDGLIARTGEPALITAYYEELRGRGMPIVLVDNDIRGTAIPFSGTDDYRGGWLAAEHLAGLGHRVIGHLPGEQITSTGYHRKRGFAAYMATRPDLKACYCPVESFMLDAPTVAAFLTAHPALTAVVAASDFTAETACEVARQLGRRVPQDLSVMGFGNLPFGRFAQPALTTIDQMPVTIGENAARMIIAAVAARHDASAAKHEMLTTPTLIVRASTQPPPAR